MVLGHGPGPRLRAVAWAGATDRDVYVVRVAYLSSLLSHLVTHFFRTAKLLQARRTVRIPDVHPAKREESTS